MNPEIAFHENGIVLSKTWMHEGKVHRVDGPASLIYHDNGILRVEEWFQFGKLHRTDGPACITYDRHRYPTSEKWYFDNVIHRVDGPADILLTGFDGIDTEHFVLHGVYLSKDEHTQLLKLDPLEMLIQLFEMSPTREVAKHIAETMHPHNPILSKNYLAITEL